MIQRVQCHRKDFLVKHREMYIFYSLLLKHFHSKNMSNNMNLIEYYKIVADYFYIDTPFVSRVIRRMQKLRYIPNQIEIDEFRDKIGALNEYAGRISGE